MKTQATYYEIAHGTGIISVGGKYSFEKRSQAVEAAIQFKADPKSDNKHMSKENEAYWKKESYTVVKKTVTRQEIITI